MNPVSFQGIGSGMPVQEIVDATLAAEAAPIYRMEENKEFAQVQLSAYAELASRLNQLNAAMNQLNSPEKFQQLAAQSSQPQLFTAQADHLAGATLGNYQIEVLAEARADRFVSESLSAEDTFAEDATLEINGVTLEIGGLTADQVREKINSHEDLRGVASANLVNEGNGQVRLTVNASQTGNDGRLTIHSDALTASDLSTDPAADLDARIRVDGIESRSSTNTFANVISGVTINVAAGAGNLPAEQRIGNLNVDQDKQAIKDNIDAFVMAYNDVIIHLNEAKKGPLGGEGVVRSIETQLRNELYTPTGGEPENMLALIGIETYVDPSYDPKNPNPQNGTLRIDSAKLNAALDEDFDRVAHIIGHPEEGYAARFGALADSMTKTTVVEGQLQKGLIETRTDGLNNEIKRIDDRIEAQLMRLDQMEQRLYRQFAAADAMAANMNATGMFIQQQMAGLPGYTR